MSTDYLVFLGLYLVCLVMRAGYEFLKRTGRVNPRNIIVFAAILLAMCLLWTSSLTI